MTGPRRSHDAIDASWDAGFDAFKADRFVDVRLSAGDWAHGAAGNRVEDWKTITTTRATARMSSSLGQCQGLRAARRRRVTGLPCGRREEGRRLQGLLPGLRELMPDCRGCLVHAMPARWGAAVVCRGCLYDVPATGLVPQVWDRCPAVTTSRARCRMRAGHLMKQTG